MQPDASVAPLISGRRALALRKKTDAEIPFWNNRGLHVASVELKVKSKVCVTLWY